MYLTVAKITVFSKQEIEYIAKEKLASNESPTQRDY